MTSADRALLVTDLVDSTRLAATLGDAAMSALWQAHDALARELLHRWRGREIDKSDGFLILFDAMADAAGFALDYHRALAVQLPALQARVGLHWGTVALRENRAEDVALGAKLVEIDGLAKPIAARVMSLALGGQTLLTAAARVALARAAPRIEARGHWRMKGLDEPVELFEIGDADAPFTPPVDTSKVYRVVRRKDNLWLPLRELRHGLPAERDSFIGRTGALREIAQRFEAGTRLVSVLGIGGTGKTRLALRFGWAFMGDFAGGAWFCDLAQARSVDGIAQGVAEGLGITLGSGDPVERVGQAIAGRGPCLLILDNFEQVAALAEATVGRWLAQAREASLLVTSRETLAIAGERALLLDPMTAAEGEALFRERAAATGHRAATSPADEAAIAPLVELLDRLPLAIELAAARVGVMGPRMLLERMGERFKLLRSGTRRLDRQATLRAALDWSWDLLPDAERAALAQLSVFEGRITLAATEATLDLAPSSADAPTVLDALQALVGKSLLRRRTSDDAFDLLRSVQDYAAGQLARPGAWPGSGPDALAATQARHARYFAALGPVAATADACADLDNLHAATRRAAAAGSAGVAVGALEGAWAALRLRGPYQAGVELAEAVRAMPGLDAPAAARVERVAGWALQASGRLGDAVPRFNAALAAAIEAGDKVCEGHARVHLGDLHVVEGQIEPGRVELGAALALAREAGDAVLECEALCGLGNLESDLGNLGLAAQHHESALAAARRVGDRRWEGGCRGNLGAVCADQGRNAEARKHYEAALAIARELGDRQWEGNTRCNIGLLLHGQGDMDAARDELCAALALARDMGHLRLQCIAHCNLGLVFQALSEVEPAQRDFEASLAIARSLGDRRTEGQVLGYLGLLFARQARFDEARACLDSGEGQLNAVGDRLNLGLLLCGRAECEELAGAPVAARAALAAATALAAQVDAQPASELGQALDRVTALVGAGQVNRSGS